MAVAPSYLKGNSEGEFVFDWSWADFAHRAGIRYYPKVVVAVPFTPATGDRVLVAPGEDRAEVTRLVAQRRARVVRGGSKALERPRSLSPADEAPRLGGERIPPARRLSVPLVSRGRDDASTSTSRASTSKRRNQIKRELRGVARARHRRRDAGAGGAHARDRADDARASTRRRSTSTAIWGRLYLNERFFEAVVERFRDRLAWVVARDVASGRIVAGAFNVAEGRRLYGRYWGARSDVPFLHFAVCYYAGIAHCVERGIDVFEPGAGGEHKRPRGFVPTLTHSAHWLADAEASRRARTRGSSASGRACRRSSSRRDRDEL